MIAAAVLVACLVALLAVSQKSEASFPGKNGSIAFQGFRDAGTGNSNSEIITVSPDGTGMKQLTSSSGGSSDPTYSPDGEMIVWALGGDIWVMNRSGNAKTKKALTNNGLSETSPAWSPDGNMIALVDGGDIWTVKPDGSQRRNITNTPDEGEFDPDFSPDGQKLAFTSNGQYKKTDIYTMNLDGSALTNVTDSRYVDEEDGVWSPSGNEIAYSKALVESVEIFKKKADGTGGRRTSATTPNTTSRPTGVRGPPPPQWSLEERQQEGRFAGCPEA